LRFWIDAQLPPLLAEWLSEVFGQESSTLEPLGLRRGSDDAIFRALRKAGEVIVSKDEDFVDMIVRLDAPPQLLWVTCGNVTNRGLREVFDAGFAAALVLLNAGEPVVELAAIKKPPANK
jgi:predicted nuclease of predicted toxin-antitoxin system